MKKEEFIKELKKKLDILEEKEINDIVEEYSGYIDEKIKNGATEEEAIKDFGNIDELATELLKAYKINVEKKKNDKNWINVAVEKINQGIDQMIQFLSEKDSREILRLIIEICIILIGISLCKIPFHFLENIGREVFSIFHSSLGNIFYQTWKFIMEIAYFIFAIVLFVKIFEKRYLSNEVKKVNKERIVPQRKKIKEEKEEKIESIVIEKKKSGVIDLLTSICIWFIKFIAIWILLGIGCYLLGMGIAFGISIYLLACGVTFFGIYLSIFILLMLGVFSFILIFNWITGRKNNLKVLLISFLASFILLGISFSYASLEIMNIEYIDEYHENYQTKQLEETISYEKDMILMGDLDYEIDESLENELKITYLYNENISNLSADISYGTQNRVYISWNYWNHSWNHKIMSDIIHDLKNHRLHNYSMTPKIIVSSSSKNIEQLKQNYKNYSVIKQEERNNLNSCRRQLNHYGYNSLSSYCKEVLSMTNYEEDE